jgi:hypothetical protein
LARGHDGAAEAPDDPARQALTEAIPIVDGTQVGTAPGRTPNPAFQ